MSTDLSSGKGHHDENFPVASWLVRPDARAPILAYYRFARAADDIADHPGASPQDRLARLAAMRAGLEGAGPAEAVALADVAHSRGLDLVHARDLLCAFEQDVTTLRTPDWDALIAYCAKSAMPVGRFVLDVHGEDRALWPLSDALCAALQIINHLQDCGKDYRALNRVYVPSDMLDAAGVPVSALGENRASPALRGVIAECARRSRTLLDEAAAFAPAVADRRLAAEVAVIHHLACDLTQLLLRRDPLSENVHHSKLRAASLALPALLTLPVKRLSAPLPGGEGLGEGERRQARPRQRQKPPPNLPQTGEEPEGGAGAGTDLSPALRAKVGRSSFYAGMRILPREQRAAMFAIYGFCRIVDDIADDEDTPRAARRAALDAWRGHIAALYQGGDAGEAAFLAAAVRRFDLASEDFIAVIDGMQMDVDEAIRWPSFARLDLYCDRVASAVGRLSVRVFGMEREAGIALAHHLGRALQFTNILRDIDEDAAIGRVYLPIEAIAAAGIAPTTPAALVRHPALDSAARWLVPHAHRHFAAAGAILRGRPQGHLAAPRLMEAAYARLLARMEAQGWASPRRRVRVSKPALLLSALRYGLLA